MAPWLLSREALSPLERALFGLFAFVPPWGAWDLAIRSWPAAAGLAGLLILPVAAGALILAGILGAAAILAPSREVWVDPAARAVVDTGRARWLGSRRRTYGFGAIEEVAIRRDYDADGPDRLLLVLVIRGRRRPVTLLSRPLDGRAEIEALADRLRAALQP